MKSDFEDFHPILQWEQIFLPRNILRHIAAFIGLGFLFIITGENSILDQSVGNSIFLPIENIKTSLWEECEEAVKTVTCGLYQAAVWSLLRAWVLFTKTVLTGQLKLWRSDRMKSTEQFSWVLYQPHILGGQIKICKPKNQ